MARPDESVVHGSKAPSSPSDPPMLRAAPKDLPSVDRLLRQAAVQALIAEHGHTLPAQQARALLDQARARALAGELPLAESTADALASQLAAQENSTSDSSMCCRGATESAAWPML